ncbi:MAG: sigma-54-dependent Fis family transcriptional regulator [Deltaproteobacteria bacterium]|nr:sigma-54-dependent Fis family transcriptional regulator [Deltaproteobacteria bacterium]
MTTACKNHILWTATHLSLPEDLWQRLETLGYKVLIADAGMVSRLDTLSPRLWVGQINGDHDSVFRQIQDIRSKCSDVSIVLASSQPHIDEAVQAIKLGVSDYIAHNISPDRLWEVLENALCHSCATLALPEPQRLKSLKGDGEPIAVHPSMIKVMEVAKRVAPSRSTILIKGETGVGKEVLARFIHHQSDRRNEPFVAVNCAALPENLLESELFGHEKGAFTGATNRRKGKFELADGGTLLLDEISEMAVSIQAKLLRVLQEREIDRVGGQSTIPVDVRVIATTNRDLEAETKSGNFRLDLYYRLNVVPLTLPPLRKRLDDMEPLAELFLNQYCALNNIPLKRLAPDAINFLKDQPWHGNVREFGNVMERISLLVEGNEVHACDLELLCGLEGQSKDQERGNDQAIPLKEMEKKMIFQALDNHHGNRTHAAKVLGISVRTLRNKLHEYQDGMEEEGVSAGG